MNPYEQKKLVCDECREGKPGLMSCIHTFGPRNRKSTILSEATAIPGVIPDAESDDKRDRAPLVERSRMALPTNKRLEPTSITGGLGIIHNSHPRLDTLNEVLEDGVTAVEGVADEQAQRYIEARRGGAPSSAR